KKDKYSFALNTEKLTFNCLRGKCGMKGSFKKLCQDFNENITQDRDIEIQKTYIKQKIEWKNPESRVEKYLKLRGISKETMQRRKIGEKNGNIVFPYYENGKLVLVKYRKPCKYNGNGVKSWREKGGKAVFWGMDDCDFKLPLVITEGECFSGETEILTKKGWVEFKNYTQEKVAQYKKDKSLEFVLPIAKIKKPYNGEFIELSNQQKYYSFTTIKHKIILERDGKLEKREAGSMPIGGVKIPRTAIHNGKGIKLTDDEIRLFIAVFADITIRKKRDLYVNFTKKRKRDRLKNILDSLKLIYKLDKINGKYRFYMSRKITPDYLKKDFPHQWIAQSTLKQKKLIIDEIKYWDGNFVPDRNQIEFSSNKIQNCVFIQTIAHLAGYVSTIISRQNKLGKWFKVSILFGKQFTSTQRCLKRKTIKYKGDVYCVQVSSGMIIVRQRGCISISGNCDTLALDECGIKNVVSVPSGANDLNCIVNCWDWLQKFQKIILWGDNDVAGQELVRKLLVKLEDWQCYRVISKHKDANLHLYFQGKESVVNAVKNATEVPIRDIERLSKVETLDPSKWEVIKSGIWELDNKINGFITGQVSVWTGESGSGKSVFLHQLMIESVEQNKPVCLYSGELVAGLLRYWLELNMAGEKYITIKNNSIYVRKEIKQAMRSWYEDKLFVYSSAGSSSGEYILEQFGKAAKRYNCKTFLIDNLMTVSFKDSREGYYRQQSDFVGKVIEFSRKYDVHTHVIAHPRKTNAQITKMDISGSGDITNRAANVFLIEREKSNYDTVLTVLKSRITGKQNIEIKLKYANNSKRFFGDTDDKQKQYSWLKQIVQTEMEVDPCPF
ncbi:MAG: hypothetical protein DRP78_07060, partial [Candidatus Omnitrophota bacterium]